MAAFSSRAISRTSRPPRRGFASPTSSRSGNDPTMCGIIGIVGKDAVADRLVDGLRRMEYRGYDSAGVCTLHDGELVRRRAEGKLANLVLELERKPADRKSTRLNS